MSAALIPYTGPVRGQSLAARGAGGGGGGATESADTLRSTQTALIVDLVSEGEIGGLVNGLKSVWFDGVAVENADGSRNFEGVSLVQLTGAPGQQPVDGFDVVQQELSVGVKVEHTTPVVRSVVNVDVDEVRVSITLPALSSTTEDGDVKGASVAWAVDVQSNGGGFVTRYTDTITGKASDGFGKSVRLPVRSYGPPPWDVRVRRVTADSTSQYLQNELYWASYTEIEALKLAYTYSAACFLKFDAKNFARPPQRAYDMVGVSDWLIPANYNPYTRAYTGLWNGTFKAGFTNNPAWVIYNLIRDKRYGLGAYVAVLPDKWELYELAQWCDGTVPDGKGGTQPRYQINVQLMGQVEALTLLQDIASIFRGVMLYGAGQLGVAWDAPGAPVAQYTPAHVKGGLFNYGDGSDKLRKSVCTCWWADQAQLGKMVPATFQDDGLVARFGVRPMSIRPLGVTNAVQAMLHAKWALYTNEYDDNIVSFTVGSDGAAARIGRVFQTTDPSETGERLGGRIVAASTGQVTLDGPVELLPGETYTLCVLQPDPDDAAGLVVEERPVTTAPGTWEVLNVFPAFSAAPAVQTSWILAANTAMPQLWRCANIREVDSSTPGKKDYEITGVAHNPSKWAAIEGGQKLIDRPVKRIVPGALRPESLSLVEVVSHDGQTFRSTGQLSWVPAQPGLGYLVSWRVNAGAWRHEPETRAWGLDIALAATGLLEVEVRGRSVKGEVSPPLPGQLQVLGNQFVAAAVVGLALVNTSKGVVATWNVSPDFDWKGTELRLEGTSPEEATPLATVLATTHNLGWPTQGSHRLWARHLRRGGPAGPWTYAELLYTGPAPLLHVLDGHITEDQLNAALNDRLDLVDGSGPGSVNARIAGFASVGTNLLAASGLDVDTNGDGLADGWAVGLDPGAPNDPGRVHATSMVAGLNGGGRAQRLEVVANTLFVPSVLASDPPTALEAGLQYTVSGYLRTNSLPTPKVLLQVRLLGAGGVLLGTEGSVPLFSPAVVRPTITFTAPAGTTHCRVEAWGLDTAGEWLELDAVMVQTGAFAGPYMPSPYDLAALSAQVGQEVYTRATADEALATSLTAVQAQVGANSAAITEEATARATADSAMASQVNVVSARLAATGQNLFPNSSFELDTDNDGTADGLLPYLLGNRGTVTRSRVAGRVQGLAQYSLATALGATDGDRHGTYRIVPFTPASMANLTLAAWFKGTPGTGLRLHAQFWAGTTLLSSTTGGQEAATGAWQRLVVTGAVPATADALRVYFWQNLRTVGGSVGFGVDDVAMLPGTTLVDYAPGLGDTGSAYAAVTEERSARVTETGQLSAQWSVKVDANGRWAGIITRAGGNSSTIDLLADVLRVGNAALGTQSLFAVYTVPTVVNGITLPAGVYLRDGFFGTLNGNRIVANSISTERLVVGAATAAANDGFDSVAVTIPAGATSVTAGPFDIVALATTGAPCTFNGVLNATLNFTSAAVAGVQAYATLVDETGAALGIGGLVTAATIAFGSSRLVSLAIPLHHRKVGWAAGTHKVRVKLDVNWVGTTGGSAPSAGGSSIAAYGTLQENKV